MELGPFLLQNTSRPGAQPQKRAAAVSLPPVVAQHRNTPIGSYNVGAGPSPRIGTVPVYASPSKDKGPYNAKGLAAVIPRHHVVDFGYVEVSDIRHLANILPRTFSKREHAPPLPELIDGRKATQKRNGQSQMTHHHALIGEGASKDRTVWDFGAPKSYTERTADGFLVVRAGEETYAFKDEDDLRRDLKNDPDAHRFYLDSNGRLQERPKQLPPFNRFECTLLKLDHNQLTSDNLRQYLGPVLTRILIDPTVHLSVLDLSFNQLSTVPDVRGYPLQTLMLNSNQISDLAGIASLRSLHKTLKKFNLYDNPLQQTTAHYKYAVLYQLPFLAFLDETHVTMKDRANIAVYEQLFVPCSKRNRQKGAAVTPTPRVVQ